jgi:ketosteroid isomerase-like protein
MSEVDAFLESTMPRLEAGERALHEGDVGPRRAMWSHEDPVTLFGAWLSNSGWDAVSGIFDEIASRFSDCSAYEIELIAAGASGDLAYTVAYEHTTVSLDGSPRSYILRVTQVYRREDGEWKVVHRHGNELSPDEARAKTVLSG